MLPRFLAIALPVFALFCGSGCAEREPLAARVRAKNYREFTWWRSEIAREVPPQRWAEFNGAVDEIRYDLMASGFSGTEAIGEALAARINGMTFEEVLRNGDQVKLARLRSVRDQLKALIDGNALVGTKTGDDASRDAMERRTSEQRERLDGILCQIEETRQQLVAHGGNPPPDQKFDVSPAKLARTQARSDYERLIRQRLENGRLMYGDWPARIDASGADLPPDLHAEFERKRELVSANGHVVIPVFIRAKWRLFDAPVAYPEFSPAVTANLTAADRQELEAAWAESEAEVWARREAAKESADAAVANIKSQLKNVVRP